MTPLPIVTQPEPDESWRSYLARVATLYHCTSETLGAHLGLRDTGRWPAHHGITLDSDRTRHAADILGLDPAAPEWASESATDDLTPVVDRLVATVLSQREQARARKDWASADAIRDALKDAGLTIEDTKDGARWSLGKA